MKINYWHYWLEEKGKKSKDTRYIFALDKLLSNFSNYASLDFKKKLRVKETDEEFLILKEVDRSIFLFLKTLTSDILKLVNDKDFSVENIDNLLNKQDKVIAHASYVGFYKKDPILTMGSTLNGPSASTLGNFINKLLEDMGYDKYIFCYEPIGVSLDKNKLNDLSLISTTEMRIPTHSGFLDAVKDYFLLDASDCEGIKYLTLKIGVEREGNIKSAVKKIVDKTDYAEKFKIRAKEQLDDKAMDYFLFEQGQKCLVEKKPNNDDEAISYIKKAIQQSNTIDYGHEGKTYEELEESDDIISLFNDNISNND